MQRPEAELIAILLEAGVDFAASLPCDKIKSLLETLGKSFYHVPLTREEEGVGICAGAALAGKRPVMFVQSSGIGNMLNALLSLTDFYQLPLAVFVSRRGMYKEKIEAQVPMGKRLPDILRGAEIEHTMIDTPGDYSLVRKKLPEVYRSGKIHVFMLSPALWEDSECVTGAKVCSREPKKAVAHSKENVAYPPPPSLTRYEILEIIAPFLRSKAVVCNLGIPSKELFHINHQPSNFYMLGSMGMATPIGLGISLASDKDVAVIDGDGSLLMNPGTLATAAYFAPANLTIVAIDNGSYGSTGNQPTLAGSCVDLESVARGFGIRHTYKASTGEELVGIMKSPERMLRFIHALALPGNRDVPNIQVHHLDIKKVVQDFLKNS
jgi:sulfopyruvate decarboxylase subunit beta